MEQMFNVSSNPHVRARMTTAKIMQLVVIALLPAALMGIYNHGLKALAVLVDVYKRKASICSCFNPGSFKNPFRGRSILYRSKEEIPSKGSGSS